MTAESNWRPDGPAPLNKRLQMFDPVRLRQKKKKILFDLQKIL